jgi:hypothetical protein
MEGSPERNERGRRVTSRHHETMVQPRQHQMQMCLADVFFRHDRASRLLAGEMAVFVIKATRIYLIGLKVIAAPKVTAPAPKNSSHKVLNVGAPDMICDMSGLTESEAVKA